MKLSIINDGRTLKVQNLEQVIDNILNTIKQNPPKTTGLQLLGHFNLGEETIPLWWSGPKFMMRIGLPPGILGAFSPKEKIPELGIAEYGLYIFPLFLRSGIKRQKETLHHELIHAIDPKTEMEKEQRFELQNRHLYPWGLSTEIDAILSATIEDIVNRSTKNKNFLDRVKDKLRVGKYRELHPGFANAPEKLSRIILTKTYNALADKGLLYIQDSYHGV